MELNSATVGNGRVAFQPEIKPTPEAKETSGKAIIVTSARPGRAASYDVTFVIDTKFACNGLEVSNVFHWEVMIPEDDHHASFRSVEDRAMKLISPMLRAVADRIEADLPDVLEPAGSIDPATESRPPAGN